MTKDKLHELANRIVRSIVRDHGTISNGTECGIYDYFETIGDGEVNNEPIPSAKRFLFDFMIKFDENGLAAPPKIMMRRAYSVLDELKQV